MADFKVYAVDDEEMLRDLLDTVISPHFPVSLFSSAEAVLEAIETERPGIVVLDIGLPGIDGYECCRMIRESFGDLPVLFVSGHDTVEARLTGYDAGGNDFIVKPFDSVELVQKLKVFHRTTEHEQKLTEQAEASDQLSSLVLASMDESGLVLQFLSKAISCETPQDVGEALLHLMRGYRLSGAIQTHCDGELNNQSSDGEARPLESSVMDHLRTLGRLFEFKNRSVFNFDRVTLMVTNMPIKDSDFCGRIRDNLTMALQGADARLAALELAHVEQRKQLANQRALESIKTTIADLQVAQQTQQMAGASITEQLQEALMKSYVHLGLTDGQEHYISDLVQQYLDQLVGVFDQGEDTQKKLSDVLGTLEAAR